MGPDTEDRLKRITADAAAAAAREAMEHFYNEKMLPVLVRREKRENAYISIIKKTFAYFLGLLKSDL